MSEDRVWMPQTATPSAVVPRSVTSARVRRDDRKRGYGINVLMWTGLRLYQQRWRRQRMDVFHKTEAEARTARARYGVRSQDVAHTEYTQAIPELAPAKRRAPMPAATMGRVRRVNVFRSASVDADTLRGQVNA